MSGTMGVQLRSLVTPGGELELSFADVVAGEPGDDEIVVKMLAAPINPSDIGLLLGAADAGSARSSERAGRPVTTLRVPAAALPSMSARFGQSLPVGNEGAGVVVAAGSSDEAQALLGKAVAIGGGATYAQYRTAGVTAALVLPEGATATDGASCFVNPLTALGMVETMRAEGHTALVHTAAASNLGLMLVKICRQDGIGLVNVVRSSAAVERLRASGAAHVCDSTAPTFEDDLAAAVGATGATLAFDALGGGSLVDRILNAMEAAAAASEPGTRYSRYGTAVRKQAYIYGGLESGPTELRREFGYAWSVGGWLLTYFLAKTPPERLAELKARIAAELKTTFASAYTRTLSLAEVLEPQNITAYAKRATGEKYLIDPSR